MLLLNHEFLCTHISMMKHKNAAIELELGMKFVEEIYNHANNSL